MFVYRFRYLLIGLVLLLIGIPITGVHAFGSEPLVGFSEDQKTPPPPTTTPTSTLSATLTPTPLTVNPNLASFFLPPGLLDDFDRPDGSIGSNWSGSTSGYTLLSNLLDIGTGQDIYWNVSLFGVDQQAFVTLESIDASAEEIGLILKAQSSNGLGSGLMNVLYHPAGAYAQVWTYSLTHGWQQRGSNIAVSFSNGDEFKAEARANGQVEVYKNGASVGIRDVSGWPFFSNGGYIGLFNINTGTTQLDDFGGGTTVASPTLTPTPLPCTDPLSCDPVSAIPSYWRCNTPTCIGNDWLGAVIAWPSWAAYDNNGRTGNNSRTVYSMETNQPLPAYMGSWANGCRITAEFGIVLVIEWERGTDVWEEFYLDPGENHVVNLTPPQNGVLIEGPDGVLDSFRVSLSNCNPAPVPTLTPTATPTATPTSPPAVIIIGETNILSNDQSGHGDLLYAQQATLSQNATLQSMSFYVVTPSGQLRLGLYNDAGGIPGTLVGQTAEFTPIVGWNTRNVLMPTNLQPGNYWLAFLPQDDNLGFRSAAGAGINRFTNFSYGPLPNPFPASPSSDTFNFSLYATLLEAPTTIRVENFEVRSESALSSSAIPVLAGSMVAIIAVFALGKSRKQ